MRTRYGNEVVATPSRADAINNMQKGSYGTSGEVFHSSLWDTFTLASTVLQNKLFAVPINQGSPAKTEADTNMLLAGVMPNAQKMIVSGIKLQIVGLDGMTDVQMHRLYTVLTSTTAKIEIPGKDNLGLFCLSEIIGASLMLPQGATYNNAALNSTSGFKLSVPIILAANTPFAVNIVHHAAPSAYLDGVKIKWIFSGVTERLS